MLESVYNFISRHLKQNNETKYRLTAKIERRKKPTQRKTKLIRQILKELAQSIHSNDMQMKCKQVLDIVGIQLPAGHRCPDGLKTAHPVVWPPRAQYRHACLLCIYRDRLKEL